VFGEVGGQHQFLVMHPPQLNGDVCDKQNGGPQKSKLSEHSDDLDLVGEIGWRANR
jgi:hypothetical protein